MKILRFLALVAAGLIPFASAPVAAKPSAKGGDKPAPSPPVPAAAPQPDTANPTARWLLQQNGQDDAITLPLREVIHAATGKNVLPFDPTDPADKAFLARLGGVMDKVLPRINRPDSAPQTISRLYASDEIATQIENEITTVYSPGQSAGDRVTNRGYPDFHLLGPSGGKPYYLTVVLHGPDARKSAWRSIAPSAAFRVDPAAGTIGIDGCCLLIGIEYEMKPDATLSFLNWDIVDVSNVPIRAAITFEASGADVYHPGAVLTDGRKGTD